MRGEPITISGARDSNGLKELRDRLTSIGKYRLTTVQGMVLTFLGVLLALAAFGGWHRSFRKGLRIGSLAFMWAVTIVLFEALFNPALARRGDGDRRAALVRPRRCSPSATCRGPTGR